MDKKEGNTVQMVKSCQQRRELCLQGRGMYTLNEKIAFVDKKELHNMMKCREAEL